MKDNPKCLVTGGSGFIGSHLVEVLIDYGWDVTILDIRKPQTKTNWLQLDIRSDLSNTLMDYDIVFHLAAIANARKCSENPVECHSVNINGTLNLLNAAKRAQVKRFVLASSAWLAGIQKGKLVHENSPIDMTKLNTLYGYSKLAQENLCIAYKAEYGAPDYTILRYGSPFGERMWKGLVVRAFLEMASTKNTIKIMGDGKQQRDFLYVKDLCRAHTKILKKITANKIYYLTGDKSIDITTIAKEIIKYYPAIIEYVPSTRNEPVLPKINNSLSKKELRWKINTTFKTGIKRCYEWWDRLSLKDREDDYWC